MVDNTALNSQQVNKRPIRFTSTAGSQMNNYLQTSVSLNKYTQGQQIHPQTQSQIEIDYQSTSVGGDTRSYLLSQQSRMLKSRQNNYRKGSTGAIIGQQSYHKNYHTNAQNKFMNKGEVSIEEQKQEQTLTETIFSNNQEIYENSESQQYLDFKSIKQRLFDKYAHNNIPTAHQINIFESKRKSKQSNQENTQNIQTKSEGQASDQNHSSQPLIQVQPTELEQLPQPQIIQPQNPQQTQNLAPLRQRLSQRKKDIILQEQQQLQTEQLLLQTEEQILQDKKDAEMFCQIEEENLKIKLMHQRMLGSKANSEVIKMKQDYDSASKSMMDYRMNLLSSLIERKLGLKKRNTKAESMINSLIYDISKERKQKPSDTQNQDKQKVGETIGVQNTSLSWHDNNLYSHVQSRVHDASYNSHYHHSNKTEDLKNQDISRKLKEIYQDNSDPLLDQQILDQQEKQEIQDTVNFLDLIFDQSKNNIVNERQFMKIKKMIDDYYGYKPQSLKYETALKRINEKKKLRKSQGDSSSRKKKQSAVTKLFMENDDKGKMSKLEKFIKTYNYYIHKLLWSTADPYLQQKRKQYQQQCESHRLDKFANVFNRLKFDTHERKKTDEEILKEHAQKYQDPFKNAGESYSPVRKYMGLLDMNSNFSGTGTQRQDSRFSSGRASRKQSDTFLNRFDSVKRKDSLFLDELSSFSPAKNQQNLDDKDKLNATTSEFQKALTKLHQSKNTGHSYKLNEMDMRILNAQKKLQKTNNHTTHPNQVRLFTEN
eukprot:403333216